MKKLLVKPIDYNNLKNGAIHLQGAKNSMLNNLCLPLFTKEECIIENVPDIQDINANLLFLSNLGCDVKKLPEKKVIISCKNITNLEYDPKLAIKTTGSKLFIPILTYNFGSYNTGMSQGCNIGDRGFENYANSLKNFGIRYEKNNAGIYKFYSGYNVESCMDLPFPSFGLTVNAILAAQASGHSIKINNICLEPEIDNTIEMLIKMGGSIKKNDNNISINRTTLSGCEFRNMSDRNVAVTYSIAALILNIELVINNYDDIKMEAFYRFLDALQVRYTVDENKLIIYKSNLSKVTKDFFKIKAFLYPDFHSDWQPLISPLLAILNFDSYIEEWLFQNRLSHWKELEKLGANFNYDMENLTRFSKDGFPHAVSIHGGISLKGTTVYANDLRSAASLVLAALAAKGETIIENIEELDRGYEDLIQNLQTLGAKMDLLYESV